MSKTTVTWIISAALVAALVASCKPPPMPAVDDGQAPEPAAPPPAVEAPAGAVTADIGDVQRGTWASHVFTIKNDLDRVMHIKNVRGS